MALHWGVRFSGALILGLLSCAPASKGPALSDLESAWSAPYAGLASKASEDLYSEAKARLDASRKALIDRNADESERQAALGLILLKTALAQARILEAGKRYEEAEARKAAAEEETRQAETLRAETDEKLERAVYENLARGILEKERERSAADETRRAKALPKDEAEARETAARLLSRQIITELEMRINPAKAMLGTAEDAEMRKLLDETGFHLAKAGEALTAKNHDLVHAEVQAGIASVERLLASLRKRGGADLERAEDAMAASIGDTGAEVRRESRGLVVTLPGRPKGTAKLDRKGKETLDGIGRILASQPTLRILVESFSGTPTGPAAGVKAALARSNEVSSVLAAAGVKLETIQSTPYGTESPMVPCGDPKAARSSERIELVLVFVVSL